MTEVLGSLKNLRKPWFVSLRSAMVLFFFFLLFFSLKNESGFEGGYKISGKLRNSFLMAKIGKDVSTRGHQTR